MKKLRKLGTTVLLTFAIGVSVMSAEPPCGSTEPGQIPTPPCAVPLASRNLGTAAGANETSFTRIAADVLLNFLPLF
jgi:hypothetical protein